MTRGNQREKAREKAQKKQKEHEKKKTSGSKDGNRGMTLEERRHRDAEIMRQKQDKSQVRMVLVQVQVEAPLVELRTNQSQEMRTTKPTVWNKSIT